uniref:DUF7884 domain-containing protein n=1 Tax=Rhizobium meliloti TaxID=382 RepID=UPI003F9E7EA5
MRTVNKSQPMLFENALSRLVKIGTLTVTFPDGRIREFGTGEGPFPAVAIRTQGAMRRLLLNPALALGEAYMDGDVEPARSDLFSFSTSLHSTPLKAAVIPRLYLPWAAVSSADGSTCRRATGTRV